MGGNIVIKGNGEGGVAVATYAPPQVTCTIDAVFPDDIEVQALDTRDGAVLVAVVEMASPRNKDRLEARDAFTAKCAAYLQRGLGVLVVNVVTTRLANLHARRSRRQLLPGPGGQRTLTPDEPALTPSASSPRPP